MIGRLIEECGLPGILGDCHASGTDIIRDLGAEHARSGKPICYTSADSVFQIAAHEAQFGLDRLYATCRVAKVLLKPLNIARVIARPFMGEAGSFVRTSNRKDFTTPPHGETLLDRLFGVGRPVIAIGKIADIFAHRGITRTVPAGTNRAILDAVVAEMKTAPDGSLIFANFVDFDALYGHRRDIPGYAAALEAFDSWVPEIKAAMRAGDLSLLTADHGCDPTWPGTDHTRERVPVLCFGPEVLPRGIGSRQSYADVSQTIARHLGIPPLAFGVSCIA
jgi:phosphopentomutase